MKWPSRCEHRWEVVRVTFSPPPSRSIEVSGFVDDSIIWGATNVTQRCGVCGRVDVTRYIGRVEIPGWSKAATA